jgi:hypothetical protein
MLMDNRSLSNNHILFNVYIFWLSDAPEKFVLGCQHSVVRMVSSGIFHNTVTFQYSPPKEEEINATDMC